MVSCLKKLLALLLLAVPVSLSSVKNKSNRSTGLLSQHPHCSNNSECPTWYICNSTNTCQCGNDHDQTIVCNEEALSSAVLDCYCVTHDQDSRSTYLGLCFYNCNCRHTNTVHEELPANPEMLSVCEEFNRAGMLCGDCKDGYSPLVFSYNLSCVRCPDGHKNWWKFILAGFLPLIFFYLFVIIFNINVITSRLHGPVWFSQALAMPVLLRNIVHGVHNEQSDFLNVVKVFTLFYSFWNLDIFGSVLPDICLNLTTLQALALDYLIAFYPYLLILLSHMIIKLHDRQVSFITIIWKPFKILLAKFRQSMDVRTSVIDSFATFFFLSYIKFLSITSDLLVPTRIYQLGSNISILGLFYSPTVVYFGEEHLPYAILAIFISIIFFCVPTILLLLIPSNSFKGFFPSFPTTGTISVPLLTPFKAATRMGLSLGHLMAMVCGNIFISATIALYYICTGFVHDDFCICSNFIGCCSNSGNERPTIQESCCRLPFKRLSILDSTEILINCHYWMGCCK